MRTSDSTSTRPLRGGDLLARRLRSAGWIETTPPRLELFAQSLGKSDRVALEVTGNAREIARIIEPHVAQVLVVSPSDTGIRQARAKTDRLDARAVHLAGGEESGPGAWLDVTVRLGRRRTPDGGGIGSVHRDSPGPI